MRSKHTCVQCVLEKLNNMYYAIYLLCLKRNAYSMVDCSLVSMVSMNVGFYLLT